MLARDRLQLGIVVHCQEPHLIEGRALLLVLADLEPVAILDARRPLPELEHVGEESAVSRSPQDGVLVLPASPSVRGEGWTAAGTAGIVDGDAGDGVVGSAARSLYLESNI